MRQRAWYWFQAGMGLFLAEFLLEGCKSLEVAESSALDGLVEHGSGLFALGGAFSLAGFVALGLGGIFVDAAV